MLKHTIVVELCNRVDIKGWTHWLIEQLNGRHRRVRSMIITYLVQCVACLLYGVALSPSNWSFATAVVEPVLGARSYIEQFNKSFSLLKAMD